MIRRTNALKLLLVLLGWLGGSPAAVAQERILDYDVELELFENGSLEVTEHIRVRAEGSQIRRGIYRDFPTRYRDARGNRVVVDFEVLSVSRDGAPEPWFTENLSNGVRINTGNNALLPTPLETTYTLQYRTSRQVGFFSEGDELYFSAIGTGWAFGIEAGSVELRLPEAVAPERLKLEGYTGRHGARGTAFQGKVLESGTLTWSLTEPLKAREGLTVVASFPKGIVTEPSSRQRWAWFLRDNRGVLVAIGGLLLTGLFCFLRWLQVGRDPESGPVIARYDPPVGFSPGGLRFVQRMAYDQECYTADLLDSAVHGALRICAGVSSSSDSWRLERDGGPSEAPTPEQAAGLKPLFKGQRDSLDLDNEEAARFASAIGAHGSALKRRYQPQFFRSHGGSVALACAIPAASTLIALILSGGTAQTWIFGCLGAAILTLIVFAFAVKARTPKGRLLMDEIEGLKLYLSVAERDELGSLPGPAAPALDAPRYERLLPFAVALDVEDAWTERFQQAVGAAAARRTMDELVWYHGPRSHGIQGFTSQLSSQLGSQIASSATPPGSTSGAGGGGFSGGGGGGGGGGGR